MKKQVSQTTINKVLQTEESKEERKKDLIKLYGKSAVILLLMNIVSILLLCIRVTPKTVLTVVGVIFIDFLCITKAVGASVTARKAYKKMIDDLGAAQLSREMSEPETDIFFVTEENVETYTFVTEHYLVISHGCAYAISDIEKIEMYRKEYSESQIASRDLKWQDALRNLYAVKITNKAGKVQNTVMCLLKEDATEFGSLMRSRGVLLSDV